MKIGDRLTIRKLNFAGETKLTWTGKLREYTPDWLQIEARFDRYDHVDLGYAVLEHGDRFIEWFFTTRWYSIYQIHAHGNDALKGWYCNITRPAMLIDSEIHTVDLALDLWVDKCGTHRQLDTDEFAQLPISTQERSHANAGLSQLHELVEQRLPPFHIISRSPAQP
ncbi:MAG: DUF402 domain-containing protein [Anaerolineales bacterium]|nr:DUF402 domain-containing protein [Anaerolineales bacterium]